jgi:inner membrane protein
MDNLTHSLTGALTAKFIESRPTAPEEKSIYRRTFFWLFVLSANLPDIDVLLGLIGDPILSIKYHRGITHSLLFAPVLALVPSTLFVFFSKVKNIKLLWIIALLGVVLHILFDLVTSFGTQILLPLSGTRYALDWMFIVDPVFTVGLGLLLALGKFLQRRRSVITSLGIAFMSVYLMLTAFNHGVARVRVQESAAKEGIGWTRISALPQPLSIFKWQGLVQTEEGVWQTFFSLFDDAPPSFTFVPHRTDSLVILAKREPELQWYLSFARHPSVQSYAQGEQRVVEFRDLMFSVDEALLKSFGFTERSLPLSLSYVYDVNSDLVAIRFDGKEVRR